MLQPFISNSANSNRLISSGNYSIKAQSSPLLDFAFMEATKMVSGITTDK